MIVIIIVKMSTILIIVTIVKITNVCIIFMIFIKHDKNTFTALSYFCSYPCEKLFSDKVSKEVCETNWLAELHLLNDLSQVSRNKCFIFLQ